MNDIEIAEFSRNAVSGWVAADPDAPFPSLQLYVNDQLLGEIGKSAPQPRQAGRDGWTHFRYDFDLDKSGLLSRIPQNAVFRLVRGRDASLIREIAVEGQSPEARFANAFGEDYALYPKGGRSFVVPLRARAESWWAAAGQGLERIFARAGTCGYDVQIAYGSLLGCIREGSFVPHDDDIDLVLFCGEQDSAVAAALEFRTRLRALAGPDRVRMDTNGQGHVHFSFERSISFDIFAAWSNEGAYFQNFTIAGNIPVASVLPSRKGVLMGTPVLLPHSPDDVLGAIYGPGWKTPDPMFRWKRPASVGKFFSPIHNYGAEANKGYWEDYYARQKARNRTRLPAPSQFAAFALDFFEEGDRVVEFGCGNGRDTLFFSAQGWDVLASDYSRNVVEMNRERAAEHGLGAAFEVCNVADTESMKTFLDRSVGRETGKRIFYSRFFLHAISAEADANMRQMIDRAALPGDLVVFETRISGDETRPKVTPEHYRRVIDGEKLIAEWERLGWEREYVVSGTGFAKYKQDDALVCRFVLRKTP